MLPPPGAKKWQYRLAFFVFPNLIKAFEQRISAVCERSLSVENSRVKEALEHQKEMERQARISTEAMGKAYQDGIASGRKEGFAEGKAAGLDARQSWVTIKEEQAVPLEWNDFSNDEERQDIATLVQCAEWTSLANNLKCQAILKWRQARQYEKQPEIASSLISLGSWLIDLIAFYEQAAPPEQIDRDSATGHGYDSALSS